MPHMYLLNASSLFLWGFLFFFLNAAVSFTVRKRRSSYFVLPVLHPSLTDGCSNYFDMSYF